MWYSAKYGPCDPRVVFTISSLSVSPQEPIHPREKTRGALPLRGKGIEDGSFAPQRRKENRIVSDLADQGLLLNGEVSTETISAFALTRNLNPRILLIMYQQAGLIPKTEDTLENPKFPDIFRSRS